MCRYPSPSHLLTTAGCAGAAAASAETLSGTNIITLSEITCAHRVVRDISKRRLFA
ncbi:unnamed protein product [Spodoptera littoralis]|uniref:Uncharacterized protein n=1 Tax=Spodoptera littoralis TaxID=7109 RepID=A0A9P0NAJ0_SPOLI|nr:unnamed protein product [Spodoptera littoralis]CAH1647383.1 unnamed protein product [Spodoptera littoralis]